MKRAKPIHLTILAALLAGTVALAQEAKAPAGTNAPKPAPTVAPPATNAGPASAKPAAEPAPPPAKPVTNAVPAPAPSAAVAARTNAPAGPATNPAPTRAASATVATLPANNPAPTCAASATVATLPANKPAPTNPPPRNIRFQFDGIPYMDVIERFAQMAGKPLVTETNVQGTLTFNDAQPYVYGEALDMLNVMLAMKGAMLMESGHYLQLVPVKELPQMPLRIMRGVDQSGDVRPGEVATVVLPVKNVDSKEIADAVTAMLSNAGSLAALSKGRGLIITDRLANIQRIRLLLSQIDTESTVDRQMRTHTLLHASGAIVCDLLNRTFGSVTAPKRTQFNPTTKQLEVLPPDPNEYITAVYDDASRTLVLFGPIERLDLAEDLISRFEEKDGGAGDVRIYYPQSMKPEELASLIRQAVPGVAAAGETSAAAATKARLIPDTPQNRLIVSAPIPGQLDEIENLITRLDKGVQGVKGSSGTTLRSTTVQLTRVFRPRASDATNVAQILTAALTRKQPNGQMITTASVSCDPGTLSVVVSGSPGDVQVATDIVSQLETGSTQPTPMQTRFIEVGTAAEAKRLLPVIEQIYRDQVSDGSAGQGAHAKILADPDSGRLIVTASEDHLARIESLVRQIRGERARPQERRLEILALKNTRVETLLKNVTDLATERMNEKRFQDLPKPLILPDPANNRLLVTATDDQLKEIEQVVTTLDVTPQKVQREMTLFPVQSKSAAELIALASQLLIQLGEEQPNPQLAAKLVPDASGKQIIVLATAKDLERIQALLKQLDAAASTAVARQFKSVELFSRTAGEFTPMVQQLYQEQLRGLVEPAGGPATLISDTRNNRIMISGTEKEIARAEAIVRQLDPEGKKAAREETRVIRLKAALAGEISTLVEKSLNAQSQQVKVMVDQRSNSLVVTGDAGAVDEAAAMIQQLDSRPDSSARETRLIDLRASEAGALGPTLTGLLTDLMRDRHGPDYVLQTKIVPDAAANRLIVTGPKEELNHLATLVQQLDQLPEQGGGARIFKLNTAEATALVSVVSNAMLRFDNRGQAVRKVTVAADEKSNSLIVSGSRTDLQDAAVIIDRLDGGEGATESREKGRELKILEVKSEDVDQLASLAMKVFAAQTPGRNVTNLLTITPEPSGRRLIVLAPASLMDKVQTVVTTLDAKPDQGLRELASVSLKNASATELLPVVQRIYTEQSQGRAIRPAMIYADTSATRFNVYGTREQAAQIRQIVETLESQQRAPRDTKVFELGRLAEAQRLLPLAQQLYRDQVTANPATGPADAQMVSDGKTGRLIVSARQDQMKDIEAIFARLTAGAPTNPPARETRAFEVGSAADVQRLLPLVQQLYRDQWQDKIETDPADAQIVADAKTGRLIVTGKPEHIKAIEAILKQLNTKAPGKGALNVRDTRIFDLTTASAIELATTVRSLYLEQAKNRLGTLQPDTLILPDAGGNRLIVVGETEELDEVEGIIKKLDKVSAQSSSARIFKLKLADPAKVAEILTNALVRYDAYGRALRRCGVSVDTKSRMLIVTGDSKELQGVSVIIDQLDTSLGERPERQIKVLTIKQGKAADLVTKARQLFNDQINSQPELGTTDLLMLEDATSNQVILAGTDAQLKLVEKILRELQAAAVALGPRVTRMIDLGQVEEMQRLLPLVQQLYQDRLRSKDASDTADAQILADPKTARFVVTGRTNHIAEIEAIVKELRAGQTVVPRDTRVMDLTTANAMELAVTVRSLYQDQLKSRPTQPSAEAAIVPDAVANRLVLSGPTNELDVVEDLVRKLDKVGAQSASVRVFKLKSAEPDKVLEILQAAMVRYDSYGRVQKRVSMSVDPKSRTLIVTGDPKELQGASVIIEQLDSIGGQPERKMKLLAVKSGKAGELMTKVRALYDDQVKAQPELGTSDVLLLEDATSNQLILAGSDKQLKLVESIARELEMSGIVQETKETRVYELTSTSAPELATTVKSLYQEAIKTRPTAPASQALVLPDVNANRLIVSAGTNDLKLLDDIIQKLDKTEVQTGRTRVFRLKQAEAEQVATLLSAALVQITPYGRSVARVSVGTDTQNNLIIVSGAPQDLQSVAVIVEQMDTLLAKEPRQLRVLPLKSGVAAEIATRVKSLYQDQLKGRPKVGGADAVILGDDVANRLIVTATESHMKLIEEIVGKLQEVGEGTGRQTRVLTLQRTSATSVAAMVSQLFARQVTSEDPSQRLSVSASGDDRLLVVDAAGETLTKVEQLVKSLDGEEIKGAVEVRTYQIPDGKADELAQSLAKLFAEKAGAAQPSGLAPRFEADPKANVLMVAGTKEQFEKISKLIEDLKKTAEVSNEVRTFILKNGDPEQVSTMLEDMLGDEDNTETAPYYGGGRRMRWRPGRGMVSPSETKKVHVAPAPSLNAVVVQGPPVKLALAEKIIQSLDKIDREGQSVIQSVHLKKAHAADLAEAVTKTILSKGAQSRVQRVNVTAVEGPNNLLISGPSDAVQDVMKIIRELDVESEEDEIEVRIYKLENGTAKEVSAVVQQLLQSVTRAESRMRPGRKLVMVQPSVSVDDRSNSLIISATTSHFKIIEKMLAQLDKATSKTDRDVHFVWLKNGKADDIAPKIKAIFEGRPEAERPVVDFDSYGNSITVIARRADLPQIQDLITRLDESTKDTTIQVRLRALDFVPAEQMAQMLRNIYPQMSRGTVRIVEKLGPRKTEEKPKTDGAGADTNAPPRAAAAPEVVVAVEKGANALILSGPVNELDQIERIISDLSYTSLSNEAEMRLFNLKEADPVIVARTINELFRQEEVRVEHPQLRALGQPGEVRTVIPPPKMTVVAEPRTRSVIVRAKPTDFTVVETLIKQLDVSGLSQQIGYRLVPLTNAQPQKVLPLVQQMVSQLNLVRPGEPLTVTVDARSRGLLVVARDTILAQIEKMIHGLDTTSDYAEGQVLVVSLKKASAPQLAQVLNAMLRPTEQNVVTPEARELQEQVRKLKILNEEGKAILLDLTKPIKVMADPQLTGSAGGNRLIVTSTADNLKALGALIAMMDTVPVLEGVDVKLVRLEHADAASVSQTLTTIFTQGQRLALSPTGQGQGQGQPEGAAGKALTSPLNVAVDARANTLILSGQKETLELALRVVEDLDKQIERFVTEVRLFRLKHASAIRLLPLLQAVFAEGPAVPGSEGLSTMVTRLRTKLDGEKAKVTEAPKARQALAVQADDLSNTLIVAARSDSLPLIADVISQLDIPAASGLDTVRIYPLQHADVAAMSKIIADLYGGPRAAQMRTEDKPSVTVDERVNALIVVGNTKAFAIIEGLLQKLDQKLPFELRDVHILPLQHADVTTVAGTLQRLMDARVTQRAATSSRQAADSLKVIVLADERSNSLLVGGGKDSFELVESLAQQLDEAEPALSGRIRLIPLEFGDARTLATTLTTLFTQRYAAARTPEMQRQRPVIVPDPRSNSLLVAAGQDDNQALDDLLKKLDQKLVDPSMTVMVYPLRHNDSARISTTLDGIFAARMRVRTPPGQQAAPQDTVRIETDALNNALIVYASKENQEMLKDLLEKIDAEPSEIGGVVEAFVLEYADASRVASMLRTLVQQGLYRPGAAAAKAPSGRDALAVTVDPRSNTLIVSASPENLLVVKEIIRKMDTRDFAGAGNVKLYSLKKARASSLATVLEQFFRAKRTGEAAAINAPERTVPVAVIPDDRSNLLLVTGSKESFDVMDRLVEQLDGEDVFARMNFRVFPLKKATAMKLQNTLRQIVANRPPRVKGETPEPINVVADSWVNALLVGASAEDLTLVESLIERLDSDQAELGIAVQVLPLAKADARRVATTVQALFREGTSGTALPVMVNADERINGLVVSAGEADLKRISELVKKLDTDQVSRVSEIKVIPLHYARAELLAATLNTALNTKQPSLTEISPNTQSLLQFITRTEEGKELVTAALKEAVLITADARMNALIVSGPVDYMGLLEQIINKLDSASPQTAKIKVFALQNADAHQMATLLMQLFRMQQAPGATPNQRSIQYTLMRPNLDPEVMVDEDEELASATLGTAEQSALTVTVDARTNSLLVGGTEHYVDLVSKIIEALDASPAQERRTELYRLKNAQAQEVATALRSFLDMERQRVTQVLGAEAVGTAQRLLDREVAIVAEPVSNTLLLSANPRYFDEIKKLIEDLDQPQPQVLIQVLLAEVTLDSANDLGVEWRTSGSMDGHQINTATDFGVAKDLLDFGGFSTAVTGDKINFLLRALQNDGRLEVLSRPQILTADNKVATINVGQRVPIITDTRITTTDTTINSYRYEEVGITLTVTPRIGPEGVVKMEVGTTNATMSTSSQVPVGQNLTLPVFNQRRANTTVSVQSGQTVVIGGLIETQDETRTKRVPFLGSVPYLGVLFRSQTKSTERRELLIFLTPQVVFNVRAPSSPLSMKGLLERETTNSTINTEITRDNLSRQLLDPIFPDNRTNNAPAGKPGTPKKGKSGRSVL